MKKALVLLLSFTLTASGQNSSPLDILKGILSGLADAATETTQLLNRAALAAQVATSALQLSTARSQLTTEQQTLAELLRMGQLLTGLRWTTAGQDLQNIAMLVQQGQGVAFSMASLDQQFRIMYPGFNPSGLPYFLRYRMWQQSVLDTIYGTVRATGGSWQQMQNETGMITYYQSQANTLSTQQQSLMLQNELGAEALNQLNKLRQMMLADIQQKAAYEGYELQKDMDKLQTQNAFFANGNVGRDGIRW